MNNIKVKGVRDLMNDHRYQWKHIAKELMTSGVPGSWDNPQNIYNLVNGNVVPKDAYVYVVFARIFNTDIKTILIRYSSISNIQESIKPEPLFESKRAHIDFDEENLF